MLRSTTKIIVLMHWKERHLTTNTATYACRALPGSEIHLRGHPKEPLDASKLITPGMNAALLFPSGDSQELTSDWVSRHPGPLTLIVPDGNWRQAAKVAVREPALKHLPRLRLPPGPPSTYRLRVSRHEQNLSTFEAISRAIGIVEGPESEKILDLYFLKIVERVLWTRGKLKAEECTTGIPEAAIQAHRDAGVAGGAKPRRLRG